MFLSSVSSSPLSLSVTFGLVNAHLLDLPNSALGRVVKSSQRGGAQHPQVPKNRWSVRAAHCARSLVRIRRAGRLAWLLGVFFFFHCRFFFHVNFSRLYHALYILIAYLYFIIIYNFFLRCLKKYHRDIAQWQRARAKVGARRALKVYASAQRMRNVQMLRVPYK